MTQRRASWVLLAVGTAAFVVLTLLLVPLDPVPGGPVTPPPASSIFTAEQIRRAEDFSATARMWSWCSLAVSLAIACALGFTSAGRRLVETLPGRWWVQVPLAVATLTLLGRLVTLPFALLQHDHFVDYGLSTQTRAAFLVDVAKAEAIQIAITSLALLVAVGCARRWRDAWPWVTAGLLGVLVLLGSFAYPLLVEPVFNHFEPLPDGSLRSRILALADEEGVEVDDVLVADASRRTTTLNAYVSGFGSTRRVVVYDNLVDDLPEDEALSVVAHELAHARHDDVVTGSLLGVAGTLVAVGLAGLVVGQPGADRRGRAGLADPRVVPLVLALVAVGGLLASPVQNAVSRRIETRADVDALRVTGDPEAFEAVQKQLSLRSLADPTPPRLSQLWFGSHPTALERIAVAQRAERRES